MRGGRLNYRFTSSTLWIGGQPLILHVTVGYFFWEVYVSANRTFIDTRKRTKLCSECEHWKGYESANRHLLYLRKLLHFVMMRLSTNFVGYNLNAATTNGCESYHAHLNAEFYSAQPNIYLFVETLLRQQISTYISLASLSQSRPVHTNRREKSAFLRRMYTDYRGGHLSRKEYLQPVSYRLCPAWMFYGTCHDVEIFLMFFTYCHSFCFYTVSQKTLTSLFFK